MAGSGRPRFALARRSDHSLNPRGRTRVPAARSSPEWRLTRHPPNQVDAPRNSPPPAPKTKHARNQAGTNAADAAADRGGQNMGGARKGAGRKPPGRPSMPHVTRPKVDPRFPVQVTIRATPGLPSLRSPSVFEALRRAITRASIDRFRVIHFSIQQDHAHFIVEGDQARPCPRWRARAGDSSGARRQSRAGT